MRKTEEVRSFLPEEKVQGAPHHSIPTVKRALPAEVLSSQGATWRRGNRYKFHREKFHLDIRKVFFTDCKNSHSLDQPV